MLNLCLEYALDWDNLVSKGRLFHMPGWYDAIGPDTAKLKPTRQYSNILSHIWFDKYTFSLNVYLM